LRDFSGLKLDELGAQIGTSRTTYDKYAEGKSFLAPSEEQKQALRTIIEHRLEVMREAMNLLDSAQ
jgi:transcriptional regulator with XRE-family HTH domain